MNENNAGIGVVGVLQVGLFLSWFHRSSDVYDWHWIWVFSPIWIASLLALVLGGIVILIAKITD